MPEREKRIRELQGKQDYHSYQEKLAFAKELNILRNDFYYQMLNSEDISLIDFLYQPLDILSGDAYSARYIDEDSNFYFIVDGMGKGLSASLTAVIMTSFTNHLIDKMIQHNNFCLNVLIEESIEYMKSILLDEEAVAVDYMLLNASNNKLSYAKFAMPASLMQDNQDNIIKIKSNNPPLSKYTNTFSIDKYEIKNIEKFLFVSDGMLENTTSDGISPYTQYIEHDFKHSFTKEDLKRKFFEGIDEVEDDISLIFIHKVPFSRAKNYQESFTSSLADIEKAALWYENLWNTFSNNKELIDKASLVFTELYMNAYEHGNLGMDTKTKHRLIDDDIYFETLRNKEKNCKKKIEVKVSKIDYNSSSYIITQIIDEGEGFDTQILSQVFRNSQNFNGRGVFVSRNNSLGIYYNSKGTHVLYLHKI